MGNIITKDPDTIHWESNKNNSNQLTNDAKTLLGLLPDKLDASSEKPTQLEPIRVASLHSDAGPKGITDSLGPRPSRKISEVNNVIMPKQTGGSKMLDTADLSDTSPFISSDMYKNLINANNNIQTGGTQFKNADDSSTSSTSSSDDETNKKKKKKNKSDKTTESVEVTEDSDNSNLSYVSSSAHTGGGSSSESSGESEVSNDSNKSTEEKSTLNVPEITEAHNSNESTEKNEVSEVPEINKSDDSPEVMGYSANSPEPNEATPVSPPKKSKKKDAKKSKDDSSSSSSPSPSSSSEENKNSVESIPKVSVEEDSIENKNSNLPPSEINTSAIEMVSAS